MSGGILLTDSLPISDAWARDPLTRCGLGIWYDNVLLTIVADVKEMSKNPDVSARATALIREFFEPELFSEGASAEGAVSRTLFYCGAVRPHRPGIIPVLCR